MKDIKALLSELCGTFGPSGREEKISEKIESLAMSFCDEAGRDAMGNLIFRKHGSGKKLMFASHMDSTGIVATYIDENGFIRFGAVGGVGAQELLNARVVFENGTSGVVSKEEKIEIKDAKCGDLFVDIGAGSKEEAEEKVKIGDMAVFNGKTEFLGNAVMSQYLDNRAGCAALILAMSKVKRCACDVSFVFTVQEEVGLRGATTAAFSQEPDVAIAIDVTDTGDVPGLKHKMAVKMFDGPASKVMDRSVICSGRARDIIERSAKKCGVSIQSEIMDAGGTDAGVMQKSRAGVITGAISIPTRYIHTPCEMASLKTIEETAKICAKICETGI